MNPQGMVRGPVFVTIVFLLVSFVAYPGYGDTRTVQLTSLNWPPYISQDIPDGSFTLEIVDRAFEKAGYSLDVDFYPWRRALALATEGSEYDGTFPAYKSRKRLREGIISDTIVTSPLAFHQHASDTIQYEKLTELESYRIGVVTDYFNTRKVEQADYLRKESVANDLLNLRKLLHDRIDLIVIDHYTACDLIQRNFPEKQSEIKPVKPYLKWLSLHVMFDRDGDRAAELNRAFNRGLQLIKQTGEFDKILRKHGFQYKNEQLKPILGESPC